MPFLLDAVSGAIAMLMRFQEVRLAAVPQGNSRAADCQTLRAWLKPIRRYGPSHHIREIVALHSRKHGWAAPALPFGAGCFLPRQGDDAMTVAARPHSTAPYLERVGGSSSVEMPSSPDGAQTIVRIGRGYIP
jgi:hypothetical protein